MGVLLRLGMRRLRWVADGGAASEAEPRALHPFWHAHYRSKSKRQGSVLPGGGFNKRPSLSRGILHPGQQRVTSAGRCPRCARCRRSSPCRGPPWHLRAMVDSYTEWSRTGALTTWSSNSQNNFLTRSASSCRSLPPSNVVASYSGFGGASTWGWMH